MLKSSERILRISSKSEFPRALKWRSFSVGLTSIRAVWVVCSNTMPSVFWPYQEKAPGHEHENSQPKDEAALSLQAGFAEQVFEAAIGHVSLPFNHG